MPRHRDLSARATEGDRLVKLRERLGLSQRELATEFNVTSGAVAQWETHARTVPGPILRLLELYEREAGLAARKAASGPPTGWLRRNSAGGLAAVAWLGMRPLLRADEDSVAARTRLALARSCVRLLGDLKGLGMKVGQMLSYMDFALPPAEADVLASLQTGTQPMSPAEVARAIKEELGKPPGQLFAEWSPVPLAAASIGQVHRATLASGEPVVVKVQYPKMVEALQQDLRHLRRLDQLASQLWRGQQSGVLYEEMKQRLLEECDYVHEARWQEQFRDLYADHPAIVVPQVVPRLSSRRVLTSHFVPGRSFADFAATAPAKERVRAALALFTFHWGTILRRGWFNTDPHPGNVLCAEDGRLAFVDFGRVQEFPPAFLARWKRLLRATLERDKEELARVGWELRLIADPARFDHAFGYRYMLSFYRPFLTDSFRFSGSYVRWLWQTWTTDNVNTAASHHCAEMAFFSQLTFGLGSVLAKLDVEVGYRTPLLDLLYAPGEQRPAPFSLEELRDAGAEPPLP